MLMSGGMGLTSMTPALYASLSDWQIYNVIFAEKDKDGHVIPEWKIAEGVVDLVIEESWARFKSKEELEIPDEVYRWGHPNHNRNVPQMYVLMFWDVWRKRGTPTEEIMTKWKEEMASVHFVYR
jgi:hypothetical protein